MFCGGTLFSLLTSLKISAIEPQDQSTEKESLKQFQKLPLLLPENKHLSIKILGNTISLFYVLLLSETH